MKKRQRNKNSMFATVHAFITENSKVYTEIPEFIIGEITLGSIIEDISTGEDEKTNVTKGKTRDKNVTRKSVTSSAITVSGALYALGKRTGNIILTDKADITHSELRDSRNLDLVTVLNSLNELAIENAEALIQFGITPLKLSDFGKRVNTYINALKARDSSGASKTSAVKTLDQLFKEGDEVIDILDKLAEGFRESNVAFYNGYKAARVIKNLGVRHES